jgi:hypothetical protein
MRIAAHGLAVTPPAGWSAQIYYRRPAAGEVGGPTLHAATVPLPRSRADFGSDVAATLGPSDVLVVLFGYGPESAGRRLFAARGLPRPQAWQFSPRSLQRTLPGQAGYQRFFSWAGRPFCLYVVLGSFRQRTALATRAGQLLDQVHLTPVPPRLAAT